MKWPTDEMRIEARSYRKAAALTTATAESAADLRERADELERFAADLNETVKCSLTGLDTGWWRLSFIAHDATAGRDRPNALACPSTPQRAI